MAAAVESMMYVGKTPWHEFGNPVDQFIQIPEAINRSGLDWQVELQELRTQDGKVSEHRALVRLTDNKMLDTVGPDYEPLQNRNAFDFFQPFLDAGIAHLHTAGSLYKGKKIWILAKISGDNIEVAKGDELERFVLLSNAHQQGISVRVGFTPIRVVCANTLALAHSDKAGSKLIRIRHTSGLQANLDAVREIMNLANSEFEATAEQYRRLANKHINQDDVKRYIGRVFGAADENGKFKPKEEISSQLMEKMSEVFRLTEEGRGTNIPSVRGTLWGAYNGVTEWLSYNKGNNNERRLDSLWFGEASKFSKEAFDIALSLAV